MSSAMYARNCQDYSLSNNWQKNTIWSIRDSLKNLKILGKQKELSNNSTVSKVRRKNTTAETLEGKSKANVRDVS